MAQSHTPVPRGQVTIPPEICEYMKDLYKTKGGITAFSNHTGIKSDTLRVAMKRGTTTPRTLERLKSGVVKPGVPVLATKSRTDVSRAAAGNGHLEPAVEQQIGQLPPVVLRHIERVSSALLDGMQLMQLTILKVLQEELMDGQAPQLRRPRGR
jgi:hypothetical protein